MANTLPLVVAFEIGDSRILVVNNTKDFDQVTVYERGALPTALTTAQTDLRAALVGLGGDCLIPQCLDALYGGAFATLRDPRPVQDQRTRDEIQASVRRWIRHSVGDTPYTMYREIEQAFPSTKVSLASQQKAALVGCLKAERVYGNAARHRRYTMIQISSAMTDIATIHILDPKDGASFEMGNMFVRTCWFGESAFSRHIEKRMQAGHYTAGQIANALNRIESIRQDMAQLNDRPFDAESRSPGPFPKSLRRVSKRVHR
ncbi:hypothetical protein LTR56_027440 [Elasticomyces elasticus]|nr:hypothetical protein LTR56_027440 [Elasticomyces elasticus]KAK3618754.1 hypothetical protein LTR22_026248 [Elasticomyces elasticus]